MEAVHLLPAIDASKEEEVVEEEGRLRAQKQRSLLASAEGRNVRSEHERRGNVKRVHT